MKTPLDFFKSQIGKHIENGPSPAGNWLKGVLKEAEEGKLVVDFLIREEMSNPAGMLHGGIISLIADEMIGMTIATLNLKNYYVSINLNVDFLFGIRKGETVRAVSKIIRKGENIVNTECQLFDLNNKLLAKVSSNSILSKINNK